MRLIHLLAALAFLSLSTPAHSQTAVRGVLPRAKAPVVMDGKLDEWSGTFSTPVNFGHADWGERAAVWHSLWDEDNLYIGLEWLDTTLFNKAPGPIYNGDGVEFYLDVREPGSVGMPQWASGTVHLFFTAASNGELKPRIQIRGGIPAIADVKTDGMECAAVKTPTGYSMEFKLPWSKFPGFKPAPGREIGMDCELCSSDGAGRVDRCWVYSGVPAVAGPAAFGRIKLVDAWDPADAAAYSDVLFPTFLARSTPMGEPATVFAGVSPSLAPLVKRVELSAGDKKIPVAVLKKFGPGWTRAQACLVGYTAPADTEVTLRFFGDGDKVLGTRTVPLR